MMTLTALFVDGPWRGQVKEINFSSAENLKYQVQLAPKPEDFKPSGLIDWHSVEYRFFEVKLPSWPPAKAWCASCDADAPGCFDDDPDFTEYVMKQLGLTIVVTVKPGEYYIPKMDVKAPEVKSLIQSMHLFGKSVIDLTNVIKGLPEV